MKLSCVSGNNILILSAGRRVELMLAFREASQRHFAGNKIYLTDVCPERSAACQLADKSFRVPRADSAGYVDFILKLCEENSVKMVIPTIDTELYTLAKREKEFKERKINLIVSSVELVAACRDKRKTIEIYRYLDLSFPQIYAKDNIEFPCFCKPYDGSCSIGASPLYNQGMLTPELLSNEKNIFMELVGTEYEEYTIDAYYDRDGHLCCLVPRLRIEVRGGEVSKGATRKNYVYEHLRNRLTKLRGGRGCITFQVFANPHDHSIKALEINPRFGGGFPLSCAAGADYPDWLIREYLLDEKIDFYDKWEDKLLMLRYDAKVLVHED